MVALLDEPEFCSIRGVKMVSILPRNLLWKRKFHGDGEDLMTVISQKKKRISGDSARLTKSRRHCSEDAETDYFPEFPHFKAIKRALRLKKKKKSIELFRFSGNWQMEGRKYLAGMKFSANLMYGLDWQIIPAIVKVQ